MTVSSLPLVAHSALATPDDLVRQRVPVRQRDPGRKKDPVREKDLARQTALLQQGDPVAIAALLNRALLTHGVSVKVQRRADRLHVLLEAESLPHPLSAIGFIGKGFHLLGIETIRTVTIYGRRQGDRLPSWRHTLQFMPSASSLPQHSPEPDTPAQLVTLGDRPAEIPALLKRPEAVILLLCFSLILFWDAYLALLEQAENSANRAPKAVHLSSAQLARRLKTSRRRVRDMKRRDVFSEWTRRLDPEGMAWAYRQGVYIPATVSSSE